MRFFKFLHRRTKSDSAIPSSTLDHILHRPRSLDAAQAALFTAVVPACPQTFLYPTPTNTIFELQSANTRLEGELSTCTAECQQLKVQLDATHADLFTQLHQNRLLQQDREEILKKLAKYERFLSLMINVGVHQRVLGDAHAALRAGVDPDLALVDAIKDAATVPGSPWSTIIPSVTGPRTQDEYKASLNMTLKARKELRDAKKVAKYWKQLVLENAPTGIVTPSVSSISSIHEPLPPERQKAVDELISTRRRASLVSEPQIAPSYSGSSTSSVDVTPPDLPAAENMTPTKPVAPPLSPLASDSFKTELASVSSGSRLFKRPASKPHRPVLGQIDSNIPSPQRQGYPRSKSGIKQRVHSQNENIQLDDDSPSKPRPRPRELAVANVVPSFSKHSLCSTYLGPLGRIEEERDEAPTEESALQLPSGSLENGEGDEESTWMMVERPDSAPGSPQTLQNVTPSRLPKPVLRRLNRLSLTKSHCESLQVPPLVIRKRSTMISASPTRLPVSTQSKWTGVRR
ncbi:hypothetical protein C8F01DRAFT_1361056 [Mycena amicta]|nr:hypothetical protein C8F01DRAFT_1361056 [Mycena amicta]